jgi:hypothetical protein
LAEALALPEGGVEVDLLFTAVIMPGSTEVAPLQPGAALHRHCARAMLGTQRI